MRKLPLKINISKALARMTTESERLVTESLAKGLSESVEEAILHGTGPFAERPPDLKGKSVIEALMEDIQENGIETDLYCPGCGMKGLKVEQGPGDYYQGPTHICIGCKTTWHLP